MRRPPDLATVRAAWWTYRSVALVRRQLRSSGLEAARVPAPPVLRSDAKRGVDAVLRRMPHTCLERALVLQKWLATQGEAKDVVIGVTSREGGFRAHAWVEEAEPAPIEGFAELQRVPLP